MDQIQTWTINAASDSAVLEGVQGLEEEDTDIVISPWMMMISGGAGLGVLLLLALSALLIHKLVHAKRGYTAPTTQVNNVFCHGSVKVLYPKH